MPVWCYLRFCFNGRVKGNLSSLVESTTFLLPSLVVYFSWLMIPHWTVFITFPWGPSSCTLNISDIVYWLTTKLLVAEIISTSSTSTATDHYELSEPRLQQVGALLVWIPITIIRNLLVKYWMGLSSNWANLRKVNYLTHSSRFVKFYLFYIAFIMFCSFCDNLNGSCLKSFITKEIKVSESSGRQINRLLYYFRFCATWALD